MSGNTSSTDMASVRGNRSSFTYRLKTSCAWESETWNRLAIKADVSNSFFIGADYQHVGCIRSSPLLVYEFKSFTGIVQAFRIGTTLAVLLQDKEQGIIILKDRMFDRSFFYTAGMHSESA